MSLLGSGSPAPAGPGVLGPKGSGSGRRRSVTIADIAAHAGVSIPTVSKVINGHASVSPQTRQRVEDSIRDHGYRRRKRQAVRSDLIEVVFDRMEGEWALQIIHGVQRAARGNGVGVVVTEVDAQRLPEPGWLNEVLSRRPIAVVSISAGLTDAQREKLAVHSVPLVLVDPAGEPVHEIPSVGAANWSGGYAATRHLLELGHRRIAAIRGPENVLCARARLDGYRAAMDAAGAPVEGLIRSGQFRLEDGRARARELLALPERPTAIFAGNDLQALGVFHAVAEAGLRIPQDISVVGFDDLPIALWVEPELTTIRQPLVDMAVAATEMALALARGETLGSNRIELSTGLVLRGSTGPVPQA